MTVEGLLDAEIAQVISEAKTCCHGEPVFVIATFLAFFQIHTSLQSSRPAAKSSGLHSKVHMHSSGMIRQPSKQ